MKKIILILATLVASLSLVGCKCGHDVEPALPEFNSLLKSDLEMVKINNPGLTVKLMEVETELSDTLSKVGPDAVHVMKAIEVFLVQNPDGDKVVFIDRDYENDTFDMSEKAGFWVGDSALDVEKTGNIDKAIEALYKSGKNLPETIFMTLRIPLDGVAREYPIYIFGSQNTFFLGVDAGTYEVYDI